MSEPEPTSSVLFSADGTQLPDPLPVLPDALTGPERSPWRDGPEIPPVPAPPVPDGRAMREAIAAVLGEDPAAPKATTAPPPQAGAHLQAGIPPRAGGWPQQRPLPHPVGQPPLRGPAGSAPHRPAIPAPQHPQASTLAGALKPVTAADLRRRPGRDFPAGGQQGRSAGTARTGCVVVLIIFGVVAFNILAEIAQSVSALFH